MNNNFREPTYNVPRYLFKYFSKIDRAIDVLKNKRIHTEIPTTYNDIFDCAITNFKDRINMLYVNDFIWELIKKHCDVNYQEKINSISTEEKLACKKVQDIVELLKTKYGYVDCESIFEEFSKKNPNLKAYNNRVSCFSEINDSLLMWAHYANHLNGVCLRFDTTKDKLFQNVHKVDYSKFRSNSNDYNVYFTKSLDWSYEQEWRLVQNSTEEFISTTACTGIIVGENADIKPFLEFVLSKDNISLFRAKANANEFKIDIFEWE